MKFSEIRSIIKGGGLLGVSVVVDPPEAEVSAARRVIAYLENRRSLYTPIELQNRKRCEASIRKIRNFLMKEILKRPDTELSQLLKGMVAACRKLSSKIEAEGDQPSEHPNWVIGGSLGELRGVFGVYIAVIAAKHHLDVEDDLAKILPAPPENDA